MRISDWSSDVCSSDLEGLFDKFPCDAVYGMHNMPGIRTGQFAIRTGPMMAASDTWTAVFRGTGGHGAMPFKGTDPVMPAAAFVTATQRIVGRNIRSEEHRVGKEGVRKGRSRGVP